MKKLLLIAALLGCFSALRAEDSYMAKLYSAAEKGDAEKQFELGFYYAYGVCLKKDPEKGMPLIRKAAEQGLPVARALIDSDEKELAKLAEQGDVWAQNVMGAFLTTASYRAAVVMFRQAAEKGNAFAQCALGECYAQGEGVEQDFTQAAIWFHKAAEQGHPQGQLMLAMCYRQGTGVKKDEKLAAYWCRQAADQGYEKAKVALKEIGE